MECSIAHLEMEDSITHFSHRHPLRAEGPTSEFAQCDICGKNWYALREKMYCCNRCTYNLHVSCLKFPKMIRHPFHPLHSLTLRNTKEYEDMLWFSKDQNDNEYIDNQCCACSRRMYKSAYYCEECKYALDLACAILTPIETQEGTMPLTNHQHPLFKCEKPRPEDPRFKYSCNTCGETFLDHDHVYICHECKSLLHESCLALPDQIEHPFHSEHPLKLLCWNPKCRCHACGWIRYSKVSTYYCVLCDFNLDIHCATLIPTGRNRNLNQGDLTQPISPRHSHPLIQCKSDSIKNFRHQCHGCNLSFKDFVYVCFKCPILLDKSCVDLLPNIFHPFHPQHRLILSNRGPWPCEGCGNNSGNFIYICPFQKCRFSLDLKCSRMELRFTKSDIHEHALAYFDFETAQRCNICNWNYSNGFFFRCVQCNFSIHDHCHPSLPQTIKHQCHCDPLTLNRSAIQDIPDEDEEAVEFYCFACEDLRTLSHPTYYCAECHFVAHVRCVMSEILSYLERESMAFAATVDESKITQDDEAATSGKVAVISTKGGGQGSKNEDTAPNATVATAENVDPVLNEIDEKIAKLQEVIEEYTGRVAELLGLIDEYKGRVAEHQERRAQHIASVTS